MNSEGKLDLGERVLAQAAFGAALDGDVEFFGACQRRWPKVASDETPSLREVIVVALALGINEAEKQGMLTTA